jgi:hypothetical protein
LLAFGKLAVWKSDIIVGFHWHRGKEQFHQARFIRIAHWRLAILLDPLGMLDPEVVMNLLQQVRVSADLLGHEHIDSVEDSSVPGEGSFLKATTESSTGGDVVSARQQSSETISKEATSLLAVCTTLRQLDHFAALVSEQLGQQSALRKGQSRCRNVVSLVFHTHLLLGLAVLNPIDLTPRLALSLMSWLRSSQWRCHRVSQQG